jgi:hypothetical protein
MALTVADLQAALALLPSDMPVVLAEDAGGNAFSPLAATDPAMYLADTTWSGEYYLTETDRLAQSDPDEHSEAPEGSVPALFLWPTH